jgi:hypothetical protein
MIRRHRGDRLNTGDRRNRPADVGDPTTQAPLYLHAILGARHGPLDRIAERHQPLPAHDRHPVAQPDPQIVGIDAHRLRPAVERVQRLLNVVDRYEIADTAVQ